jgi:hypothetical protein
MSEEGQSRLSASLPVLASLQLRTTRPMAQ